MIEINCSYWIDNCNLRDFSDSIAVSGDPLIGDKTWAAAQAQAMLDIKSGRQIFTGNEARDRVVEFFTEFGAWSRADLEELGDTNLHALILQYIAGNYLEDQIAIENDCSDAPEYDGWFYRNNGEIWCNLD